VTGLSRTAKPGEEEAEEGEGGEGGDSDDEGESKKKKSRAPAKTRSCTIEQNPGTSPASIDAKCDT
jgi:hypothetical protein